LKIEQQKSIFSRIDQMPQKKIEDEAVK